jgi:MFS family permease
VFFVRFAAVADVFRSPMLRRVECAWAGYYVADWSAFVALSIYAYDFGGAAAVGVLGLVRALPAALGVPAGSAVADRTRRERVLFAVQSARAVALAASAAVVAGGGPNWAVFLLAGVTSGVGAAYRPAHLALVPLLARTAQELVASNVSGSILEGAAVLVGPALAGILLTFTGTDVVLAFGAVISACAAVLVARISSGSYVPARASKVLADLTAGVRTLEREPDTRLIIGLFASQTLVRGLLNVLLVVTAFHLLGIGESGVGFLNAAFGAGGLLGGFAGLGLVSLRRLARPFAAGLVMWGVPIALIAVWPNAVWTVICLATVGAGNAVLDIAGFTLIQRGTDDAVLARVFGVFEVLVIAALGVGSIIGSLLVDQFGVRVALVVAGSILPVLTILTFSRLRAIDASVVVPERQLRILQSIPLFSPLPPTTLDRLAVHLSSLTAVAGTELVREGDAGDLFYVVAAGRIQVSRKAVPVDELGPGDYFGEIALVRNVPRSATCVAKTNVELYTIDRDRFVSAITGNSTSAREIESVIRSRLAESTVAA